MACNSVDDVIQRALELIRDKLNSQIASIFLFTKNGVIKRRGINGIDKDGNLYKEKSFNLEDDIREIALQIKQRKRELLLEKLQIVDELRNDIVDDLKKLDYSLFESPFYEDSNIAAYEKLKSDQEWFAKYKNKYVAFLNGELIDSDEDEQKMLKQLKYAKYQYQPIFFTKVEENPRIVDLPPSLWFDDF